MSFFYRLLLVPLFVLLISDNNSYSRSFKSNLSLQSDSKTENSFSIQDKIIIKAVEKIKLFSDKKNKMVNARIDTGATQSSIDIKLARELGLTNFIGKVNVISANGIQSRNVVEVDYELSGKKIRSNFTVADRSNLNYPVLIGRNDLEGFLIDPID